VNDSLTVELERYKEQVKILKEGQNVDLKSKDNVSDSCEQSVEIDRLKQTLSEHVKEKESLMQTVTLLKNDFKKEESRNIDREIALEKRINQLDNIIFKRDQSKAQQLEPKLYDGNVIKNTSAIVIPDSKETLMLAEESPQSQEKDTVIKKLKERIKSLSENMNEDKTYKQLYDSIKPTQIRSKEQCDALVSQVNQKSVEISDLNVSLQEKDLVITALKNELRKHKGKNLADYVVTKFPIAPEMLKIDCNGCMLSDNHDLCVLDFINDMNARTKSKTTFTIVGNTCPLTRITTTAEVPLRKPTALESDTPKPVVTLVYSRKPRKSKTNVPVSKPKIIKSISANKKEPSKSWGSMFSDVKSPLLMNCVSKMFSVKFRNDHVAKILGYGDYQIGNVTISRVYYVEGLGHNLFSVGTDWDLLFQPLFDELLNPSSSVDRPTPEVSAPIAEVVSPEHDASTGSPSSTTVDQDAPSPSNSQTTPKTQSPVIPNDVDEDNHDLDVAHMNTDPFFGIPIPENNFEASSSSDVIPTIVHTAAPNSEHITKWTKDHPLDNIIGELERPVSTRFQLHEQALFCYYNAFLTSVEPKNDKDALTQACWIEAMQEELNEFKRGIKRTRSHLVASWITRFEDGIDFEENPCSNG
ncbi:hypothetical protein Tco_1082734, partial [Tanacetum coccineum]